MNRIPKTPWKPLDQIRQEHERLTSALSAEQTRAYELAGQRAQAAELDRQAYADALRRGKDDPGAEQAARLEDEIAAAQRKVDALQRALLDVWQEAVALVEKERKPWLSDLNERREAARKRLIELTDALNANRQETAELNTLAAWLANPGTAKAHGSGRVRALTAPNGEPMQWDELVAALRAEAEIPTPRPLYIAEVA